MSRFGVLFVMWLIGAGGALIGWTTWEKALSNLLAGAAALYLHWLLGDDA